MNMKYEELLLKTAPMNHFDLLLALVSYLDLGWFISILGQLYCTIGSDRQRVVILLGSRAIILKGWWSISYIF